MNFCKASSYSFVCFVLFLPGFVLCLLSKSDLFGHNVVLELCLGVLFLLMVFKPLSKLSVTLLLLFNSKLKGLCDRSLLHVGYFPCVFGCRGADDARSLLHELSGILSGGFGSFIST